MRQNQYLPRGECGAVRRRAPHDGESRRTCKVDRPPAARQLFLVSACRRGDAFRDCPGVPSGDDGQFVQRRDGEQEPWFQALEVFGRRGEIGDGRAPTGTEIDGDQFLRTNAAARENDERVPVQKGWRERCVWPGVGASPGTKGWEGTVVAVAASTSLMAAPSKTAMVVPSGDQLMMSSGAVPKGTFGAKGIDLLWPVRRSRMTSAVRSTISLLCRSAVE